jgi:hypothetical protein
MACKIIMSQEAISINVLPVEIYRQILLYFRPSEDSEHNPIHDIGPLMLVCKKWADIILHTALFWTTIHFTFGSSWITLLFSKEEFLPSFIERGQAFFRRTGDALLSVHMRINMKSNSLLDHLLQFIGKYGKIHQWKRLKITDTRFIREPYWPKYKSILSQVVQLGGFYNLESLYTDAICHQVLLRWIDSTSPRLNSLSIRRGSLLDIKNAFPDSMNRISALNMKDIDWDDGFELSPTIADLKATYLPPRSINTKYIKHLSVSLENVEGFIDPDAYPNLETLTLGSSFMFDRERVIVLSSVKHLNIACNIYLSENLQLPSLVTLQVRNDRYHEQEPFIEGNHLASEPWWPNFKPRILIIDVPLKPIVESKIIMDRHPQLEELRIQFWADFPDGVCLCSLFANRAHNVDRATQEFQLIGLLAPRLQRLSVRFGYPQRNSDLQQKCAKNILLERAGVPMELVQLTWEDGNELVIRL